MLFVGVWQAQMPSWSRRSIPPVLSWEGIAEVLELRKTASILSESKKMLNRGVLSLPQLERFCSKVLFVGGSCSSSAFSF